MSKDKILFYAEHTDAEGRVHYSLDAYDTRNGIVEKFSDLIFTAKTA